MLDVTTASICHVAIEPVQISTLPHVAYMIRVVSVKELFVQMLILKLSAPSIHLPVVSKKQIPIVIMENVHIILVVAVSMIVVVRLLVVIVEPMVI